MHGNGKLYGQQGNDHLSGRGKLYGGTGNDSLSGSGKLYGGTGNDTLKGSGKLYGGVGDDSLWGHGKLYGGKGNDTLESYVDHVDTLLDGGIGNDSIKGGWENDTLIGGKGNDVLLGKYGNDKLNGGKGNDVLYGGDTWYGDLDGMDTLTGGAGTDIFIIDTHDYSGDIDIITDFKHDEDKIYLKHIAWMSTGELSSDHFCITNSNNALDYDDRIIYNTTTGALLYDRDGNSDNVAPVHFATLKNKPNISSSDFFVINQNDNIF